MISLKQPLILSVRQRRVLAAFAFVFVLALATASTAHAQTYNVVYRFAGPPTDGRYPNGDLVRDSAGNLFGTTYEGGSGPCSDRYGLLGCGTVFKVDKTGKETVLHSFTSGADGGIPQAALIRDAAGNLYGTTTAGGNLNCTGDGGNEGCGVVFKLDASGKFSVLHTFQGGADDGNTPMARLTLNKGELYGSTIVGGGNGCYGSYGCGTIFKITTAGVETVLYKFTGGADGANPFGAPLLDQAGNLYSTTSAGGSFGHGTIFKLDTNRETVLYSFTGKADGGFPFGNLIRAGKGTIRGVAGLGGDVSCQPPYGCGVLFSVGYDRKGDRVAHL
jgi:uncharacterized repeat protein (TIGR03803 family)